MPLPPGCPCCLEATPLETESIVAPFLAERAFLSPPFRCRLLTCPTCGHRYFDLPLPVDAATRLYAGYRDEEYYRCRHRHEWWYTRGLNRGLGAANIKRRQDTLLKRLGAALDLNGLGSVLDYGGDQGQFIPPTLGWERYVYDLSALPPAPGVTALDSIEPRPGKYFDLLILSHILEHVTAPLDVLLQLRPLQPAGGSIYVEVPSEPWHARWMGPLSTSPRYLDFLIHHPRWLRTLDFYTTLFRVKAGLIPPGGFIKMHEHIQYFTETSLAKLLEQAGYRILNLRLEPFDTVAGRHQVLTAIGTL